MYSVFELEYTGFWQPFYFYDSGRFKIMKDVLVNLEHISKTYDNHMVLDDLNLYIRENEFLTLLGQRLR